MQDRLVFKSDRPDGRFVQIEGLVHQHLKGLEPILRFDPDMTPEQLDGWHARLAEKLHELMRFPDDVPEQPAPQMLWSESRDGYELQKWEAYPEPLSAVPFLVLVPDHAGAQSPVPAVLCIPGSSSTKELLAGEPELFTWVSENKHPVRNQMAKHYVRAGFVAVVIDNPGNGERRDPRYKCQRGFRFEYSASAMWMGRSYEGISVFEKFHILQWAKACDYIDAKRIAVCGHSLGAKPALHLSVLDPSVAAVVWSDYVSNWRECAVAQNMLVNNISHYIPEMIKWFDYVDLMASIAPRPFLITEGGRTKDIEVIRRAWEITGKQENFAVVYYSKYATADKRQHDDDELFDGMTQAEYHEHVSVDVPAHCFKEDIAVPWLSEVLGTSA